MHNQVTHRHIIARIIGWLVTVTACVSAFVLVIATQPVSAVNQDAINNILRKTLINALPTCYSGETYMINSGVSGSEFQNLGMSLLFTKDGSDNKIINIPNELGNSLSNTKVTCEEAFLGATRHTGFLWLNKETMDGLLGLYGKSATNITDFGYELGSSETVGNQGCISIQYTAPNESGRSEDHTTNSVCFKLNDDRSIDVSSYDSVVVNTDGTGGPIDLYFDSSLSSLNLYIDGVVTAQQGAQIGYVWDNTWDNFVSEVSSTLSGTNADYGYDGYSPINDARYWDDESNWEQSMGLFYQGTDANIGGGEVFEQYQKISDSSNPNAALVTMRYLTGNSSASWDDVKFTQDEAYSLLETYFNRALSDGEVFLDSECFSSRDEVTRDYAHYDGNGMWCGVQVSSSADLEETYNVVNTGNYQTLTPATLQDILEEMTNWSFDYAEDPDNPEVGGLEDGSGTTGDADGDASTMAACYKSAGALGWIMCPVTEMASGVSSWLYGMIEKNFLQVDADLIQGDGAYAGWVIFRDFANLIFVILFIIVILSQVTGIGLSNYGVKKTLPRLIAVAILVNTSFILCELAVDISNILGAGLNDMFNGLADDVAGNSPVFDYGGAVGKIGTFLAGTSGSLVFAGVTIGLAALSWDLWLLPFLLVLLSTLIGIIFFFIILGVRQAGVIILIAIAPVAIVCYALPNTKKLFDRWIKILSSLLVVYPICGVLMGGGKFASNLLLQAGGSDEATGFFFTLVAMLLSVVPFFFIPTLLKSSMAAMGALGAKISGFGSRLGHGASGALKRSERVQDWNKRLRVNTQYRRAQRTMARAEKKGRTLSASQTRRISRAKAAFEKQSLEDAANRHYAGRSADQIDAAIAAQDIKFQQQQVEEEASRIMTGGVDFTDASSHTRAINANDVGDLTMAYDQAIGRSLNMANSAEVRAAATLQAKALQQLLMGKGDTGRSQMLKTLRTHTYSAQGNRAQEDAVKQLYSHLNDNDKWMASIKAADIGSYSLINDAASANPGLSKIKTAAEYNVMGSNKFTAETVGQAGDSFYDNIEQALNDGSFAAGSGNEDKLQSFDRMMTEALTNPRISVKGERIEVMNKVREAAYNARLEDYVQAATTANPTLTRPQAEAEFKAKYGDFRQLYSNDELKIPHPKAQMPTGWRRATIADTMGSHIPSGLKEGDWIQTGAGGTITRLRADEIKRAEAIEQQNIQADINNSLNP